MRWMSVPACALMLSCGGDAAISPAALAGTNSLRTVNGNPVPVTITEAATTRVELIAGAVFLYGTDSIYIATSRLRTLIGQAPELDTHTARGRYSRTGLAITTAADDGLSYQLIVGPNTLTQTNGGLTLIYRR